MKMLGSKKINQERESHISRLQTNKCFCRHKILECVMCVLNCEISVCCCRCAISLKRIRAKLSISTSTSSDWKMVIRNIWSLEHSNNRSDRVCSSRKYASTMHNLGCCCSRDAVCEYFECFFSSFLMLFSCGKKRVLFILFFYYLLRQLTWKAIMHILWNGWFVFARTSLRQEKNDTHSRNRFPKREKKTKQKLEVESLRQTHVCNLNLRRKNGAHALLLL